MRYLVRRMAGKKKDFSASPPAVVSTRPDDGQGEPVVRLPQNRARLKSFDFSRWLGRGFDELIWACISEIQAMIRAGTPRPTTVCAYCVGGLAYFFEFLSQQSPRISIGDVNSDLITAYIHWLSVRGGLTYPSQRNTYTFTKCVLTALTQRGLLPAAETLFPQNPYPQYARRMKGQKPFSLTERERIVKALKADLVAIYRNAFDGTEAEALTVHLLALCLRTGLNTTPMLELLRDCMQQHPLRDNMRLLVYTKWRAHKTAVAALKGTGVSEEHVGINGDGVALVQLVLKRTATVANDAPAYLKDRLWLFRSENRNSPSRILALNEAHIAHAIRKLILRHDIRGDDGRPLRVNVFRFRKTLENRLWRLSGGDPFAVARIANHSVAVADSHYLRVTPEMQRNHKFLGEALVSTWRGESAGTKGAPSAPLPPTTTHTPVGRCKDPYQGDKAPKTGEPCMDFLSCFGCRSYVLVEDARDLHRVFSFCEFLDRERERINAADWAEHYGWIVRVVNEVAQERFNAALVQDARQRAKSDPHSFWKDPTIQAAARAR